MVLFFICQALFDRRHLSQFLGHCPELKHSHVMEVRVVLHSDLLKHCAARSVSQDVVCILKAVFRLKKKAQGSEFSVGV